MDKAVAGVFRASGKALNKIGHTLEGRSAFIETFIPSTNAVGLGAKKPVVDTKAYVASTASVVGDVNIGAGSSVWYGAVIRGDVNSIKIGNDVSVGDRAMIHCSGNKKDASTVIGNKVIIGAGAIIHGCKVEDSAMIGEGAQVLDSAVIQKNSIVAPGSLVGSGKVVKTGQLWGGIPAKAIRDLTDAEITKIAEVAEKSMELAGIHKAESVKGWQEIQDEEYEHEQAGNRNPHYYKILTKDQITHKLAEFENHQVPGRVLDSPISARPETV